MTAPLDIMSLSHLLPAPSDLIATEEQNSLQQSKKKTLPLVKLTHKELMIYIG